MSIFSIIWTALFALVFTYAIRTLRASNKQDGVLLRSVAILVLGDVGRCPRMMYHAESFAEANFRTYLIGYAGMLGYK